MQANLNVKDQLYARFNPYLYADLRSVLRHDLYKRLTKRSDFVQNILSDAARRGIRDIVKRYKFKKRFILFLYRYCCITKICLSSVTWNLFYVFQYVRIDSNSLVYILDQVGQQISPYKFERCD